MFADFDPVDVAEFNEKKIMAQGSVASSLLSESKLRAILENARQMTKVFIHFLFSCSIRLTGLTHMSTTKL